MPHSLRRQRQIRRVKSIAAPRQPLKREEMELEPLEVRKRFLPSFQEQYEAELEARAMPPEQMPGAATNLERVVYKALWDLGYRPPDLDFQSSMIGGRLEWGFGRQVADIAIHSLGIVIEVQGQYWHQFGDQEQRDMEREVRLRLVPRPVPWLVYFLEESVIRDRDRLHQWLLDHVIHAGLHQEDRALPLPAGPWYAWKKEEFVPMGELPPTGWDWSNKSPVNYIINGGFEADGTYAIGWVVQSGVTATIVDGKLRINASSADNGVYQAIEGLLPDAIYTIVCRVNTGGQEARIFTAGSEHNADEIVKAATEKQWTALCRASSTGTLVLYLTAHTPGVNVEFDDVGLFRGHIAFPFVPNFLDAWRHPDDYVFINGGDIYANSITADKFAVIGTPGGARIQITPTGIEGYKAGPVQTFDFATDGSFWFGAPSGANSIVHNGTTTTLTNVDLNITDGTFALKGATSGSRLELDSSGFRTYASGTQRVNLKNDGTFWLGESSTGNRLSWDGTTLTVKGNIYVGGGDAAKTDLSNVADNTVVSKVNAGSTLITPGRILISGTTTLDDWRHPSDQTLIDGGDIYAHSVTASQMAVVNANLASDWSFEYGGQGWTIHEGGAVANYGTKTGRYALVGDGNRADNYAYAEQQVPVQAGAMYYAEVWCYTSTGSRETGLGVTWRDKDWAIISAVYARGTPSGYTCYSVLATAPSNAAFADLRLCQWGTASDSPPRFDDVVFRPASGMNLLVGTPGSARVEINNSGIEGYSDATTKQFYLRTQDGRAMFGGGKDTLDSSGLVLSGNETSYNTYNAVRWLTAVDPPGGSEVARVSAGLFVRNYGDTADRPALRIVVDAGSAYAGGELELSNESITANIRQRLLMFNGTQTTGIDFETQPGIRLEAIDTAGTPDRSARLELLSGHVAEIGATFPKATLRFGTTTVLGIVSAGTSIGTTLNTGLVLGNGPLLTISSGAITVTHVHHTVDGEGAASDDLVTINGGVTGSILVLHSLTYHRVITLKDGTGNLKLAGDFALGDTSDSIMLMYWNDNWNEISRSNN